MRIQNLAVIFIIIVLPISLVLSTYTQSRVQTLSMQIKYDSKLNDATYDALKAYQLNSLNSDTSDYTNSKMRDINASINTFFNTMATSFSTLGYTKETLQNYVPALVYTMYDGYYIYSPYKNTWDEQTNVEHENDTSYSDGENLYGLKPYVYYSCRYRDSTGETDVVITYSLDNYVQIQGLVDGNVISKAGYLLSNVVVNGEDVSYKGIEIKTEGPLEEYVCYIDTDGIYKKEKLKYIKKNGTKYYYDGSKSFSILSGKAIAQSEELINEILNNNNAKKYYKEAQELKNFILNSGLANLTTKDIVNINTGERYGDNSDNPYYTISGKILNFDDNGGIESETSNFNTHRIDVIKNSIERNLSIAISNFNNYSGVSTDFQMPKLTDSDWDKIMDNISIISFLQGVNIGGKVYNGYSIITNTKNEDIVMEDSIYIQNKNDDTFHRITEEGLTYTSNMVGIFNVNLERRSAEDTNGNTKYYFPVYGTLSYDSIVTQNKVAKKADETLSEYIDRLDNNLKRIYYTALGRERYAIYRKILEI